MIHLFHLNGVGAMVETPDHYLSSEEFARLSDDFALRVLGRARLLREEWVDIFTLYHRRDSQVCGVWFDWSLANINGASFTLFALPDTTLEQLTRAEDELRRSRDVVSLRVLRFDRMIELPIPQIQSITP